MKTFRSYLIITLGLLLNALGWTAFLLPAKLMGGGVSGIGSAVFFATGFPRVTRHEERKVKEKQKQGWTG